MQIEFSPDDWLIYSVTMRKDKINPQPQYQRTPVWNEAKKQLLIDSILRGYDLPKFYLRASDKPDFEYEVVDGQQRLLAIWEFCNDEYTLGDKSTDLPDFGDLSGKKWSELSSHERDQIGKFKLSVAVIKNASDKEIRQLFRRLQEGVTLNSAEKRNAIEGKIRDFIADLGEDRKFFLGTRLSEDRYNWHNLAAIVTCLEIAKGPTDVKAPSLEAMYENYSDFKKNGSVGIKVRRTLNYMARVLKSRPPEMNIKWGFVDLYLLISEMDRAYIIKNREANFIDFYISFEMERRAAMSDYGALRSSSSNWDEDLYYYIEAFIRSCGAKENIDTRHEVYKRRFLRDNQDLIPKDPQRAFTYNERVVIWRRDNGICQGEECGKSITFDEMEADHITPHIQGGITIIDNGQTLCRQCNASKGAT